MAVPSRYDTMMRNFANRRKKIRKSELKKDKSKNPDNIKKDLEELNKIWINLKKKKAESS